MTATKTSLWKLSRASSNFIALILSRLIRQMLAIFLELIFKGLYQSSGKEKEICCSVFPFSTKRESRHFHVVVVQRRQRNLQKSVMHVQSSSANIILMLFCRSSSRRRRRCLSSLIRTLRSDDATEAFFRSSSRLFQLTYFVKCRRTLPELNFW